MRDQPFAMSGPVMTHDLCHLLAQLAAFERMKSAYKSLQYRVVDHNIFEKLATFSTSRIHAIDHVFCSSSCKYKGMQFLVVNTRTATLCSDREPYGTPGLRKDND